MKNLQQIFNTLGIENIYLDGELTILSNNGKLMIMQAHGEYYLIGKMSYSDKNMIEETGFLTILEVVGVIINDVTPVIKPFEQTRVFDR